MRGCIDIPWAISSELLLVKAFCPAFIYFIAYMYNEDHQTYRVTAPLEFESKKLPSFPLSTSLMLRSLSDFVTRSLSIS
jgi:hypothetical protein